MKVSVPENIADIKLSQFQELMKFANEVDINLEGERIIEVEKIRIMTGLTYKQVEGLSQKDFKDLVSKIDKALNTPCEFQQRFKMNGVEFGFHPNIDACSSEEYMDLMNYNSESETLNRLMAILFRPITKTDSFGNYQIEPYEGTEKYSELFKEMPLNIVNGAIVFFLNLSIELQASIKQSLATKVQAKEKRRLSFGFVGGGMARS